MRRHSLRKKLIIGLDVKKLSHILKWSRAIEIMAALLMMIGLVAWRFEKGGYIIVLILSVILFIIKNYLYYTITYPFLERSISCVHVLSGGLASRYEDTKSEGLSYLIYETEQGEFDNYLRWMKSILEESTDNDVSKKLFQIRAQISTLQSQINPHFLYNALEVMRSYAIVSNVKQVAEMAEALSTMFRYSISKPGDICTVAEELENTSNYFIIQHYRYNDRFSIEYLFDENDQQLMECIIPRLSIQPIVENAMFHGLEKKMGPGTIVLRIYATQNRLVIRISDDGVGIADQRLSEINKNLELGLAYNMPESHKGKAHIALININQRIKLYFGEDYGLRVSSSLGVGTITEITLPLQYDINRSTEVSEYV